MATEHRQSVDMSTRIARYFLLHYLILTVSYLVPREDGGTWVRAKRRASHAAVCHCDSTE